MALKSNGTVVACGYNFLGQTNVPVGLSGVRAIPAGELHTMALKHDGMVVARGMNLQGHTNVPQGLRDIMAIAAGDYHTVALKSSYHFGGFLGPVNAPPMVNTLKAGAAAPVRFSLGGTQGFAILPGDTRFHGRLCAVPTPSPTKSSGDRAGQQPPPAL